MGDRVLVVFTDNAGEIAPAIYSHWGGHSMAADIVGAGERGILRDGDASYAAARLCGHLHERYVSTTGLGLLPPPADLTDETLKAFSHGDAGVIVANVDDGSLRYVAGYLARRGSDEGDAPLPTTFARAA